MNINEKKFNEWAFSANIVKNLKYYGFEDCWASQIENELYICTNILNNYNSVIGWGTKTGNVISNKFTNSKKEKAVSLLSKIWTKYKSTLTEETIEESNSARREITKKGKEEYIINQKVKPAKKIIIDNDASRKLVFDIWKLDKRDSLGKLRLDPTPDGVGGVGYYGVWEAVKGKDFYPIYRTDNGEKWAFTETWLSEKGVQKLQNNICPLRSDFKDGDTAFDISYRQTRRRKALQHKKLVGKENLENDAKKVKEIDKKVHDNFNAPEWDKREHDTLEGKQQKIINKHKDVNLGKNSRQHSKKDEVYWQISDNLDKISKKIDKKNIYSYGSDIRDEANELYFRNSKILSMYEDGKSSKEIAKEIDKYKKDIEKFNNKIKCFNY